MAEHTDDTEQFPWSQHATLSCRRFQLRNNYFIRSKKSGPEPVPYLEFLLYKLRALSRTDMTVCTEQRTRTCTYRTCMYRKMYMYMYAGLV